MSLTSSRLLALPLIGILALPLVGLVLGTTPESLGHVLSSTPARQALWLTGWTSTLAMLFVVVLGTPVAWALSRTNGPKGRIATVLVSVPVVLPPAVLGVALLETFGRSGWLGPALGAAGISLPFTSAAVVLTQALVAAPLFVLASSVGFRAVDDETLLVARTLGATPTRAWLTVALPSAYPALLAGLALGWLRALGEFGATLLFAGNLPGSTQTLTLAIFQALERDLDEAHALALLLIAAGLLPLAVLMAVRWGRA